MDPEFIIYQKFNDVALANELAELLEVHNVKYFLEEEAQSFNPTFSYTDTKEYVVKVMPEDFEQVNELLKQDASENIGEVESDYYLLSFSNDELMEVVTKADEWNAFDVQLARKLLAERGNAISDEEIADIEEKRMEELKEPESSQTFWIILGYILAFLGGVLGIFIGWHLKSHKKTLPNGERVYGYSGRDRWHGTIIFYLAVIVTILSVAYRIMHEIN
jgi:hypothetical protein